MALEPELSFVFSQSWSEKETIDVQDLGQRSGCVLRKPGANTVKNPNKNNALHAILFEAIALCLHLDIDRSLLTASVAHVGKFLAVNDPNIKYLALENMSRLALVPEMLEAIRRHQKTITQALKV